MDIDLKLETAETYWSLLRTYEPRSSISSPRRDIKLILDTFLIVLVCSVFGTKTKFSLFGGDVYFQLIISIELSFLQQRCLCSSFKNYQLVLVGY